MTALRIPTLVDITAGWHGLPTDVRDRIGIAVVDMIFQEFVSGDAYIATERFEDLPVYDDAIRNAAYQAADKRLNEIPRLVEAALPDLFGRDDNPEWCENSGRVPSPAARAWAAAERAERAAREASRDEREDAHVRT